MHAFRLRPCLRACPCFYCCSLTRHWCQRAYRTTKTSMKNTVNPIITSFQEYRNQPVKKNRSNCSNSRTTTEPVTKRVTVEVVMILLVLLLLLPSQHQHITCINILRWQML